MSEREKQLLEGVAKLPEPLRKQFLDKIDGAAMALDYLGASDCKEGGPEGEPGESGVSRHDGGAERDVS